MSVPVDFPIQRRNSPELPYRPRTGPVAAAGLLAQAQRGLENARREPQPAERYAVAHLAALRAAASVLAIRARPRPGKNRPTSVWVLLAHAAPELREWAAFYAAGANRRAQVQAGITRLVTQRDADDLLRQTEDFLVLAERVLHEADR